MTRAAMVIQNGFRSYCEHKRFKKNQEAAVRIQNCYRNYRDQGRSGESTPPTGLKYAARSFHFSQPQNRSHSKWLLTTVPPIVFSFHSFFTLLLLLVIFAMDLKLKSQNYSSVSWLSFDIMSVYFWERLLSKYMLSIIVFQLRKEVYLNKMIVSCDLSLSITYSSFNKI